MRTQPRGNGHIDEEGEGKPGSKKGQGQSAVVRAVTSPLNFFALIALLTNGVAGATAILAHLSEQHVFVVVLLMFALFIVLTGIVGYITVFKPRNLSPEMAKALERSTRALEISREVQSFLTTDAFKDAVRDVMEHPTTSEVAGTMLLEGTAAVLEEAAGGEEKDD